jgi:hypothetical protein
VTAVAVPVHNTGPGEWWHRPENCVGPCPLHNQTAHHMTDWPLAWNDERGVFERVCLHGIGHPDPDDRPTRLGMTDATRHDCDRCCHGGGW